jgi:O-antigen ligase
VRFNLALPARPRISASHGIIAGVCVIGALAAWGTIALSGTKIGIALALALAFGPVALYSALVAPLVFPFALFTIAVPFDNLVEFHSFGTLTRFIGILCATAFAFRLLRTRRYVTPDRAVLVWLALVLLAACSFIWAADQAAGGYAMEQLASLFALYALVSFMPADVRMLRVVSATVIIGGTLAGIYGAYLFRHGTDISNEGRLMIQVGTQNIDPNHFAAALILPSALVLLGLTESRSLGSRIAFLFCGAFIAMGLMLAASRGGIVAAIVMYLYLLVRLRRRFVLGGIGVVAVAVGLAAFKNIAQRFSQVAETGGAGRLGIWRVGLAAFKGHPVLGSGWGNFAVAYDQAFLSVPAFATMKIVEGAHWNVAPHNNLVWVAVELGAVGLIIYLAAWWLQFRSLKIVPVTSDLYPMRIAVEAALVGLFVAGLFLGTVTYKYVWLAFMLAALTRNAEICERRRAT